MSSSNLAVRMDDTATDLLALPPRPQLRVVANNGQTVQNARPRLSLTNRKFMKRDHGLKYFRIR